MDDVCMAITQIMRLVNECLRVSLEFIPLFCHREVDRRDLRATSLGPVILLAKASHPRNGNRFTL